LVILTVLTYGMYHFGDIFAECGFVFCFDTPNRIIAVREKVEPAAANGFKFTVGGTHVILAVIFLTTWVFRVIDQLQYASFHHKVPVHSISEDDRSDMLVEPEERPEDVPSTKHVAFNTAMFASDKSVSSSAGASYGALSQSPQRVGPGKPIARAYKVSLTWRAYFWFAFYLIVMTFYYLTASYIPNNWEYFASYRIARFAKMKTDPEADVCRQWPDYSCPELPRAIMRTKMIELWEYMRIKIFPSNAFIFAMFFGTPIFAFIIRSIPFLDKLLSKKISVRYNVASLVLCFLTCGCVRNVQTKLCCSRRRQNDQESVGSEASDSNKPESSAYFSLKEVLLIAFCFMCLGFFTFYWAHDHNYIGTWPDEKYINLSESMARTSGMVAVFFMSLLMFPAARNSPLYSFLGISWESSMRYHRALGYAFIFFTAVHVITNYWWYIEDGVFPHDIIVVPAEHAKTKDNFTVPLATIVVYFMFIAIGVFAGFERFRRQNFELFMVMHYISYFTLIPVVLWHAQAAWEYLIPGLAIFVIDRAIRAYRSSRAVHLLDARATVVEESMKSNVLASSKRVATGAAVDYGAAGRIVHLRIAGGAMKYLPGQYAFINVAELSLLEWHPFTISSPVHPTHAPDEITFHIKDMGPGTWTSRLYDWVSEGNSITVSLDGPYGHPIDFRKYSTVVLVAGGIGLTPVKSIFESMRLSYQYDREQPNPAGSSSGPAAPGGPVPINDEAACNHSPMLAADANKPRGCCQSFFGALASLIDTLTDPSGLYTVEDPDPTSVAPSCMGDSHRELSYPKRVHLMLAARDVSIASLMRDSFMNLPDGPFSAKLHVAAPPGSRTASQYNVRKLSSSFSRTPPIPSSTDPLLRGSYEAPMSSAVQGVAQSMDDVAQPDAEAKEGTDMTLSQTFYNAHIERSRPSVREIIPAIVNREDSYIDPAYRRAHEEYVSAARAAQSHPLGANRTSPSYPRPPSETLVFVCGPESLTSECEQLALEMGWDFHSETFAL